MRKPWIPTRWLGGLVIAGLVFAVLGVLAVIGAIGSCVLGCKAGWNDPAPIIPEPGNPCGMTWHSCGPQRGCCRDTDDCRPLPKGGCAFGGGEGTNWGSTPDAACRDYPEQSPDDIRRQEGR